MELQFSKAVRKAAPMLISVSSVSGGGKTYSALLLAAGLAGPNGRVGFIDTENGRGAMYADSPGIVAALPNGYEIIQMDAPYSPKRYIDGIKAAEKAGITVLVIDSITHEWEGIGGCSEIAEAGRFKMRNGKQVDTGMEDWKSAKREHKRLMNTLLSTNMHVIFCVRARDKVKIEKVDGKTQVVQVGLQPIQEKNFIFEMLLSLMLEEEKHFARALKCPEPLRSLFPEGKLVTKNDGEKIRQWNETGKLIEPIEQLLKRARVAAEDGMEAYQAFFKDLLPTQRKSIGEEQHGEFKLIAAAIDEERKATADTEDDAETDEQAA